MNSSAVDASALLALLNDEPGSAEVRAAVAVGAAISAVNFSEVVAKLSEAGMSESEIRVALDPFVRDVVAFDGALAYRAGLLGLATRPLACPSAIAPALPWRNSLACPH